MKYTVEKTLREMNTCGDPVFDYFLKNSYGVRVAKFHDERMALEVRDLLNWENRE